MVIFSRSVSLWYNKYYAEKTNLSLCAHPVCTQICYYCDFSKVFIKNQPVDSYLEYLLEEFRSYDIQKLRTLYIGGGTPTALSAPQLEVLLKGLTKNLDLSVLEEFDH